MIPLMANVRGPIKRKVPGYYSVASLDFFLFGNLKVRFSRFQLHLWYSSKPVFFPIAEQHVFETSLTLTKRVNFIAGNIFLPLG